MENPFDVIIEKLSRIETDISELKKLNPGRVHDDPVNDIVSINEAVKILNLAKPTIYALTSKNEIPFIKKNRKLYFSKKDLLTWLSQGKQKTIAEATDQVNEYMKKNLKKR
jgi:excisionase family DNA binding protein